ncbi:MAG: putative porin [bacterium]
MIIFVAISIFVISLSMPFDFLHAEDEKAVFPDSVEISGRARTRYGHTDYSDSDIKKDSVQLYFRLHGMIPFNPYVSVAASIASGSGKPSSNNITLSEGFSDKPVHLHTAEIRVNPYVQWITLILGKMDNPLYRPASSQMMWDSDVSPEGFAGKADYSVMEKVKLFGRGGLFMLTADKLSKHAFLASTQLGVELNFFSISTTIFAGYHNAFNNSLALPYTEGSNTLIISADENERNRYFYDYNVLETGIELSRTFFNYLSTTVFFHLTENIAENAEETNAFSVGMKAGSSEFSSPGNWKFNIDYRRVEHNAFLDVYSHSNFYGGETGAEGLSLSASTVIYNPLSLKLFYGYHSGLYEHQETIHTFMADLNVSF